MAWNRFIQAGATEWMLMAMRLMGRSWESEHALLHCWGSPEMEMNAEHHCKPLSSFPLPCGSYSLQPLYWSWLLSVCFLTSGPLSTSLHSIFVWCFSLSTFVSSWSLLFHQFSSCTTKDSVWISPVITTPDTYKRPKMEIVPSAELKSEFYLFFNLYPFQRLYLPMSINTSFCHIFSIH